MDEIHSAWKEYIRSEVNKGLPENEKIVEGKEEDAWKTLSQKIQDLSWKQECLKRYEKFDMTLSAAVYEKKFSLIYATTPLTQILTFRGKRSLQSRKPVDFWSLETLRTQTRRIGLSMSPVELLQATWTDRQVEWPRSVTIFSEDLL